MVYTASLNVPVKKALKKQAMQSTVNKISELLVMSPDQTNMDCVILGPMDLSGPRQAIITKALENRHPDVCVIFVYTKDAEAANVDIENKYQCKKITDKEISKAFEQFFGEHNVRQGRQKMTSADFQEHSEVEQTITRSNRVGVPQEVDAGEEVDPFAAMGMENPFAGRELTPAPEPDIMEELVVPDEAPATSDDPFASVPPIATDEQFTTPETTPLSSQPTVNPFPTPSTQAVPPVEQQLANLSNTEDWAIFKENLRHDAVVKHLIQENSEYVGLVNMLDVLDKRIETVWRDSALTPDQKFEKIKEIGLERSVMRASVNSINVEKVISIITTIVLSAKRTVDEKVQSIDVSLYKITQDKASLADTSYIDQAIQERTKVQLDLLNVSRSIVDLYKSIDDLVTQEIDELDRKLPSANAFINNMVKPIGTQIFTPQNTAVLANKLMKALQENRVIASQMEASVNAVIEKLFELCDKDEEIIRYQQQMINLLRANRVEDVIIVDTLLKKSLQLYVGADNTGRSATAITWSGILSRRSNTLLVDLTGRAKFTEYGIRPMGLEEFMNSRPERQFLCVQSENILPPDELQEVINSLKSRLNYYSYINVIVAPEDTSGLQQLSTEALCVHYITDCSTTSIATMKEVVKHHTEQNIARKLVTIDAPVSPLMIADSIGVDPTQAKLIMLPNIQAVRACSLRHDRPYEFNDVISLYEEAFR